MFETPNGTSSSRFSRPSPSAQFQCTWTTDGSDTAWIHLAGEIDLATAPELQATLAEAQGHARLVVADLRDLTFIDSSGIHLLLDADEAARRSSGHFVLIRGAANVERVLAIAGVAERLQIVDAAAAEPAPPALPSDRGS